MIGRILYHTAGLAFLAWVVIVPLKWAFVAGLAMFGLFAWETRPGGDERARQVEKARQERPIQPEERVEQAVQQASTVTLRLTERRWLEGMVQASNPTETTVELEAVSCRVLFAPDVGPRHQIRNRGPWRVRVEPGASFRGEVSFRESDVSVSGRPDMLVEYQCRLGVRVVPPPSDPAGTPSNPIRTTPTGYRSGAVR